MKTFKLPRLLLLLLQVAVSIEGKPKDIGMLDGNESNTVYKSTRSNFRYKYVRNWLSVIVNPIIKLYLWYETGTHFNNIVNKKVMPINWYVSGNSIKEHRDRDMFDKQNKIEYIAVITVEHINSKGIFSLWHEVHVSDDGKTVQELPNTYRQMKKTFEGQVIVFNNMDTAHSYVCNEGCRLSLTYRSNYKE